MSSESNGESKSKLTRKSYCNDFKLSVIQKYDELKNFSKVSRATGLHRKIIRGWVKFREEIAENSFNPNGKRLVGGGRKPMNHELDAVLLQYIRQHLNQAGTISCKLIQQKAREIATIMKLENFKASIGYVQNFCKRNNISCEKPPRPEVTEPRVQQNIYDQSPDTEQEEPEFPDELEKRLTKWFLQVGTNINVPLKIEDAQRQAKQTIEKLIDPSSVEEFKTSQMLIRQIIMPDLVQTEWSNSQLESPQIMYQQPQMEQPANSLNESQPKTSIKQEPEPETNEYSDSEREQETLRVYTAENVKDIIMYLSQLNQIIQFFEPRMILQMSQICVSIDNNRIHFSDSCANQINMQCLLILTIAADGTRLPTLVVVPQNHKPPFRLVHSDNMILTTSASTSIDQYLFREYLEKVILPFTDSRPCLLVLDDKPELRFEYEWSIYMKSKNITPLMIPGNYANVLQPLEISIKRSFRDSLKFEFSRSPNRLVAGWQDLIDIIDRAHNSIKMQDIIRSFFNSGYNFSNSIDWNEYTNRLNPYLNAILTSDDEKSVAGSASRRLSRRFGLKKYKYSSMISYEVFNPSETIDKNGSINAMEISTDLGINLDDCKSSTNEIFD